MDASPKAAGAAASAQHTAAAAGSKEQQQQAKQQQQQQGPASSSQQDGSQLPASLVQQSGGSGGSLKRPRSSGGREDNPAVVVAGREVVGRQVAVWSAKLNDWPKAAIAQFSPTTQKHLVRYLERKPGEVKHHEEWVALARLRFQWLTDPPPGAAPNPTSACAPRGEDAVHWRVKVFWPGMARWYVGKVTSYDPKTKKHSVRYRDGDTQELQLRHEAVQYLEREAAQQPKQQRPPAPDARKSAEKATEKRKPAAAAGGGGGAAAGGLKKAAGGAGGTRAAGTKRQRDGSAAAGEGEVSSGGRGRAAASERKSKVARGGGAAGAARGQGVGGTPVAAPATASPPKDAAAGSRDVSAAMMTGDSEEGQVDSEGGMAGSDYGLPSSSGMTSEEEEEEEEDLGSEVVLSGLDEEEDEEEEDSDFEVESVRGRRRANNKAAGSATPRSSGRRGGAAPRSGGAGARKDRRSGGAGGSARRRSDPVRSTPGGPRLARRDSARPSATAFRKVLRADEESIKAAGAGIVGARVSVFWHQDERYYKGKLVQFDGYHKRHKIVYDDGEEEWVSLPREAFRWLTPRARSAGCTPDFRHLMQQLGAEECGPPGGGVATRRQAQAGGASPGPVDGGGGRLTGEACVGWQVSLLFDGDGQRYRGEVVGWDGRRGRALVLYDDGEDEWVDLEGEELTWHCQLAGHSGVYPGLARGTAPAGTDALGWRVGVYWAADQAFYSGEVVGYDAATGRHEVAYDDGEEGPLVLGADRVKWILPPGAAVDRERLETAAEARGRRRGGDESDPDYEAFEFRPRASQPQMPTRRPFHRSISGGLSPGPTPLAGSGQPWDLAAGAEAALANSGLAPQPQQYLSLPFLRPLMGQGVETAALPLPQHLGRPLVVRQMARVPGLADSGAPGLALPQPITVRVYMSGAANSGGSAASADTQLAAPEQAGAGGRAAGAAVQPRLQGAAKLKARLRAVEAMARRAARAQQTIVKGVPTPLPSRQQMEEAGRAAARSGLTSPTAAQRLGSSHASGLHRLARGSAVNYSPFHHKRPHPADSEPDSSSGSSEEEEEEEEMDDDEEEGDEGGDNGADSAERRRGRHRFGGAAGQPSDMPLSPRSVMLNGAKIKPVADGEGEGGVGPESSCMSDGMLTSAPMLGQQSPAAILSPFKQLGIPPAHMPAGTVGEAGMDGGLAGGGLSGLLPVPASLGVEGVLAAMPHSASLGGGMDTLMLQLPLPILPRGDSAHSLAHLLPLSRTASGMLAGTTSELLGLDDGGTSGGLLGPAMSLDALQPEADADRQEAAP